MASFKALILKNAFPKSINLILAESKNDYCVKAKLLKHLNSRSIRKVDPCLLRILPCPTPIKSNHPIL